MSAEPPRPIRLLHVTTIPLSLMFLRGQVGFMKEHGFEVTAISSPGPELERFGAEQAVATLAVPMARRIAPLADLVSLFRLWRAISRLRPDIVHAHTPKAGLLGMTAATLARTPVRLYHLRGLPLETARGFKRRLLAAAERLSCRLARRVLAVSPSLRQVALREGLCPPEKIRVLAGGSGNGVDALGRFSPERFDVALRASLRASWRLPEGAPVLGFVGRLVRDKGVVELAQAWAALASRMPNLHLLLVGPEEPEDAVPPAILQGLRDHPRVRWLGLVENAAACYAVMDVVALPSYREGFPNVPLEAAAMGLPVVATGVAGCVDAVADGETGTLVSPGDAAGLAAAVERYLVDPPLAADHGRRGRARALTDFAQERIWRELETTYRELLSVSRGST